MKSIDEVTTEIFTILRDNGMFGVVYIENGVTHRVVDFSMTPYHAGALQVKASAAFQSDYKKIGGDIYKLFRAGMYNFARELGAKIEVVEPSKKTEDAK